MSIVDLGVTQYDVDLRNFAVLCGSCTQFCLTISVCDTGQSITGRPAYLDFQATTPQDPRVLDAMLPYMMTKFGNPHSKTHSYGWQTEAAVEQAREHIAKLIGASAKEIIFTSGRYFYVESLESIPRSDVSHRHEGPFPTFVFLLICINVGATESNNMAIKGIGRFYKGKKNHIITTQTEHKCVLDSCRAMEAEGFKITYLPVKTNGIIDLDRLIQAITPETVLVSIMGVNNEIGVIQPLKEIGEVIDTTLE